MMRTITRSRGIFVAVVLALGTTLTSSTAEAVLRPQQSFEQTNAISGMIDEGTGGVTEALKRRDCAARGHVGRDRSRLGLRLAIGPLERDVLTQFLVEAMVLSSFGGLIGVAVALGALAMAARPVRARCADPSSSLSCSRWPSEVLFGYFAARRAARLNPIDALRHE